MKRLRIVFVGGGSKQWAPNIIKDILMTPSICNSDIVLLDLDKQACELTGAFLTKLNLHFKTGARFIATDDRQAALQDADYVIVAISTGGLHSMAHDLAIPEEYGIYHTVGDTSGPGGWARLMRNFEVFVSLGQDINRLAPRAVVLNYTNPMTTLTGVLARLCKGPVIGLCHGLFESLEYLKEVYKLEREEDLAVSYAGLNHFFWITAARAGGKDVLADLRERARTTSLTELRKSVYEDPAGFSSHHELATELFRNTGCLPYIGDRHTCEFFACYITNKRVMEHYRLVRTTVKERVDTLLEKTQRLKTMLTGSIEERYFKRSRETAADIISAHSQQQTFIDVGNVPNVGQIANLPRGVVVETAVRVDANGFSPIAFGELPAAVAGLLEPMCRTFELSVEACFRGDRTLALQALRLDPVCAHLTGAQVQDLGQRLLNAHREFLPQAWR